MIDNIINEKKINNFVEATKKVFNNYSKIEDNKLIVKVNEEYPYIYTRDLSILIKFLIENRYKNLAKKALEFLFSCQLKNGEWVQRYDENSKRQEDKLQEDNTPLALWAILTYIKDFSDQKFKKKYESKIILGLNWIENNLDNKYNLLYSHTSNHEDGINEGYELWTNSIVNKTFILAKKIIDKKKYSKLNNKVNKAILNYLVDKNRFIRKIDQGGNKYFEADIILLSPFYFDWMKAENELLQNSLKVIEDNLYDKRLGGFRRYEDDVYFPGPWVIYSAVIAKYYYNIEEKKKGDNIINWILDTSEEGKLPEHLISRKEFYKHRNYQIQRAKKMSIKKMKKARIKAIEKLEKEIKSNEVVGYSRPILWSHIETVRALKAGGFIDDIDLS